MYIGKIQPQATDIEEVVLGGIMLEKQALITAIRMIYNEDIFYLNSHKIIFKAIRSLFDEGKNVDMLTVTYKLKEMDNLDAAGGSYYIATLTSRIASGQQTGEFCVILIERYMRRELIRACLQAVNRAYSDEYDVGDEINNVNTQLLKLKEGLMSELDIGTVAIDNLEQIRKLWCGEIKRYGIATGFIDIDNVINGLIAPDLIILAGRPGMGKTAFALNIAINLAINQSIPVGIISLEMSINQLEFRIKSIVSDVVTSKALRGNIIEDDFKRLEMATNIIKGSQIYIYDKGIANISDIRSKAVEWKMTNNIKLLIVDYIQLIGHDTKQSTRDQAVGEITKALKNLAKEVNIPIIALSQLNRNVEHRNPPEPRLSDLRESGSLEADADIVIMLYRPEYYDIKEVQYKNDTVPTEGLCFANIAKHRNGATGYVALKCDLSRSKFLNYEEDDFDIDNYIDYL